jgi:PAS domain S-box-containing protein
MGIRGSKTRWLARVVSGDALHLVRSPSHLKIGVRLTLCFVAIVVLMIGSHAFTLWQFGRVRAEEERMHRLDQESHDVLRLHADLLILRNQLDELTAVADVQRFARETSEMREHFLERTQQASFAIRRLSGVARDRTLLSTIETIQSSLPVQIDAIRDLAAAGDWPAVRLRIQNQVAPLSSLTSQLVEKVDFEVNEERAQAQQSIRHFERRVFAMHILAALFALIAAAILGMLVTRSITLPLTRLDAAAHALAVGDFRHRVSVGGTDELANLSQAFNDTAQRLDDLYGALLASEKRLRSVVEAAPVGIAVLDETSSIRIFNQRFLEITGLTAGQAVGLNLDDPSLAVLREDGTPCPANQRPSQRAITTGRPVSNQVMRRLDRLSSEQRWLLVSAWPLLRSDGCVFQVITTLTDITEQKRVEEELRSGRELLAQAQRAAKLGCFELDLQTNKVFFSAELADLFGLPPDRLVGRHEDWDSLVYPDDREHAQRNFIHTLRTGESVAEYRIIRRSDSQVRWVESRARILFDDSQQPLRLIGVAMDITDRKSAEEVLRRREEEFHILFEHAAIGLVLVDPSGHLLRSNPAFRQMLGYSETELHHMTLVDVTHREDVDATRSTYEDLVKGKLDRCQLKKRYIRKNGETRSARLTLSALRDADRRVRYCVAMVEDITEQEIAESTLLEISSRLLVIQEEERRRIAREVHDSTSQEMTALTLNLGALKASALAIPESARNQIAESLALAKQVAREIRTFSYLLHPPMLSELGLWAALRMFVQEFRERSGLQVDLEIAKQLESNKLDSNQQLALYRFVQEALANVHRHSGAKIASVEFRRERSTIQASVADAGRGMPPMLLDKLRQLRELAAGVGISGMHERLGIIGGRLEIQSDSHGTKFTAIIPFEYHEISRVQAPSSFTRKFLS